MEKTGFVFIIVAAVAILIGLAFYNSDAVAGNIGTMTNEGTVVNATFTMPSTGAVSELTPCGQKAGSSGFQIVNASSGAIVGATNYSVSQGIGSDGYLSAKINATTAKFAGSPVKVTCTYQPKGYIDDGAGRAMTRLIAIALALLILAAAIPDLRGWFVDKMNK